MWESLDGITCTVSGTPYFAFSFNGGSTYRVWDGTAARDIASSLASVHGGTDGVWHYRDNADAWAAASTDDAVSAVQEAISAGANNQMGAGAVEGDMFSQTGSAVFNSGATGQPAVCYDSVSGNIVVVYDDSTNSNYGTAVVGSVSGGVITFGTPVVFASVNADEMCIAADGAGNVLVSYKNAVDYDGYVVVGAVSGNTITFGTPVKYSAGDVYYPALVFDNTNSVFVAVYKDVGSSSYTYGRTITVSGTGVSLGTPATVTTSSTNFIACAFDAANGRVVIAYADSGNSSRGTACVGTVSGTSISFGTPTVFAALVTAYFGVAYDPATEKVLIAYIEDANNDQGKVVVGTVSGTSISFGTPVSVLDGKESFYMRLATMAHDGGVLLVTRNLTDSELTAVHCTISGDTVSVGSAAVIGGSFQYAVVEDASSGQAMIVYRDANNSDYGTAVVGPIPDAPNWTTFGWSKSATGTLDVAVGLNDADTVDAITIDYTSRSAWKPVSVADYDIDLELESQVTVTRTASGSKSVKAVCQYQPGA
jgi:hypothetical protein